MAITQIQIEKASSDYAKNQCQYYGISMTTTSWSGYDLDDAFKASLEFALKQIEKKNN